MLKKCSTRTEDGVKLAVFLHNCPTQGEARAGALPGPGEAARGGKVPETICHSPPLLLNQQP